MMCGDLGSNDGILSKSEYESCKEHATQKLQKACKNFTSSLEERDLNSASDSFESVFNGKKTKVLFLNHLIKNCEVNIPLLERACTLMTEDVLKAVDRKIAMCYLTLIEKNRELLELKTLGNAVKGIHHVFSIKRHELHQVIVFKGIAKQEQRFPILLLLQYEVFQNILSLKPSFLKFRQTSILVLQAFEKYLYDKEMEKCKMSPHLWSQFLQIANGIQDKKLIEQCLKEGDEVLFVDNVSSHVLLGKSLLEGKNYKEAIIAFEKAAFSPFFIDDLSFCHAIKGYLKEWEKKGADFSSQLLSLKEKEPLTQDCLEPFQEFLLKNISRIQSFDLLEHTKEPISIDLLDQLKKHLDEEIKRVKNELLLLSEKRLKKTSKKSLDEVEILYYDTILEGLLSQLLDPEDDKKTINLISTETEFINEYNEVLDLLDSPIPFDKSSSH